MFQRGGRAATGLAQLGMGEGDAVAMLLRNDFPFIEATIATQALNAFAVPINCPAANWAIPPSTSIVSRLQAQLDEIRETGHKLPGNAQAGHDPTGYGQRISEQNLVGFDGARV